MLKDRPGVVFMGRKQTNLQTKTEMNDRNNSRNKYGEKGMKDSHFGHN